MTAVIRRSDLSIDSILLLITDQFKLPFDLMAGLLNKFIPTPVINELPQLTIPSQRRRKKIE